MAAISGAAADAEQEQPAAALAQPHKRICHTLDSIARNSLADRLGGGKKLCGVAHQTSIS
jgi:hypothetical protein